MKAKNKQDRDILPESANDWPEVKITKITAFDMAKELNLPINDKHEVIFDFGDLLQDNYERYKNAFKILI